MQDGTREVLNLDDLLPLGGEDGFEISTDGGSLNLDIFYDAGSTEPRAAKLRIHFPYAPYFVKTPFPGYGIIEDISTDNSDIQEDNGKMLLYSLVEHQRSVLLDGVRNSSGKYGYAFRDYTNYKHYRLILHSIGITINVIAESCEIINS